MCSSCGKQEKTKKARRKTKSVRLCSASPHNPACRRSNYLVASLLFRTKDKYGDRPCTYCHEMSNAYFLRGFRVAAEEKFWPQKKSPS